VPLSSTLSAVKGGVVVVAAAAAGALAGAIVASAANMTSSMAANGDAHPDSWGRGVIACGSAAP
jgi:hypothetical protein